MSEERILQIVFEIQTRYDQELEKFKENMERFPEPEKRPLLERRFYRDFYRRRSRDIILEAGEYIIRPYTRDPEKTIWRFFNHVNRSVYDGQRESPIAELHEFMEWYCDSDVIKSEISRGRVRSRFDFRDYLRDLSDGPI